MANKSRQQLWQEKQFANKRCASCGDQDEQTLAGGRRCAKCTKTSQASSRKYKREKLGCACWRPGGRGRPPVNKRDVAKERKIADAAP